MTNNIETMEDVVREMDKAEKKPKSDFYVIGNFKNAYLKMEGLEPVRVETVREKAAFFYTRTDELFAALDAYKGDLEYQKVVNAYRMTSDKAYEFKKNNRNGDGYGEKR